MKNQLVMMITIIPILFLGAKEQLIIKKAKECNMDSLSLRESIYDSIIDDVEMLEILQYTANNINTKAEYLYLVIQHESRFNLKARNPHSNAVGLIQFMPKTLNWMGYTTEQVSNMSMYEQLQLVEKYYKPYSNYNLNHPIKLFLCTFYPFALRKWDDDNYIFGSEKSSHFSYKVAKVNKGFDLNKDCLITMREYKKYHNDYILKQL